MRQRVKPAVAVMPITLFVVQSMSDATNCGKRLMFPFFVDAAVPFDNLRMNEKAVSAAIV